MAARLLDMHPQTLRKYERLGLVRPTRTIGSMRVYSRDELERLRLIKHLVETPASTSRGSASAVDRRECSVQRQFAARTCGRGSQKSTHRPDGGDFDESGRCIDELAPRSLGLGDE